MYFVFCIRMLAIAAGLSADSSSDVLHDLIIQNYYSEARRYRARNLRLPPEAVPSPHEPAPERKTIEPNTVELNNDARSHRKLWVAFENLGFKLGHLALLPKPRPMHHAI
jgi:hypothetical protein